MNTQVLEKSDTADLAEIEVLKMISRVSAGLADKLEDLYLEQQIGKEGKPYVKEDL